MKRYSLGVIPFRPTASTRLKLPFATSLDLRAAQISVLPEFDSARPFARERWPELGIFRPNVLIGYGFDLQKLVERAGRGEVDLTSVDHAIFALTDCGTPPITEVLRVSLWQSFGVPVFELIVAPGYRLLASECEAHDGWHVAGKAVPHLISGELICDFPSIRSLQTGFRGQIDCKPCPCGRGSVRLKNLTPHLSRAYEQPLAAIA